MQNILFSNISKDDFSSIKKIFSIFKEWKSDDLCEDDNKVVEDSLKIIDILAERYSTKFWHPTKAEVDEYFKRYNKLSFEEKINEAIINKERPWDFDSWISAIICAEIALYDLLEDGEDYKIILEQLAWPSGGIEAMENLIKIYDGEIIQNDML